MLADRAWSDPRLFGPKDLDIVLEASPDGRLRSWEAVEAVHRAWTASSRVQGRAHDGRRNLEVGGSAHVARQRRRIEHSSRVARGVEQARDRSPKWLAARWASGVGAGRSEIRACLRCGLLLRVKLSPTAVQPELHLPCFHAAMRTPEGRRYLSRRRTLMLQGVPGAQARRRLGSLPVTALPGALRRDPTTLTRQVTWAVRCLIGDEKQASLAAEANVTQPAVAAGIRTALRLLPPPEVVDRQFAKWVARLAEANAARQ